MEANKPAPGVAEIASASANLVISTQTSTKPIVDRDKAIEKFMEEAIKVHEHTLTEVDILKGTVIDLRNSLADLRRQVETLKQRF